VAADYGKLETMVRETGCALENPFMALSFLALPVIPSLKLTDKGLVDGDAFDFVDLFVN
jgi:adenine deaminase